MTRRVERLTLDTLPLLPGGADACVFWQFDPVHRERIRGREAEEIRAWFSTVLREWGSCGRVVVVDDTAIGYLLWAPPVFLPGSDGFATSPVSPDAVLLATGYVVPEHRGAGYGRLLVQAMARDLVRRGGVTAVEAFGATGETGTTGTAGTTQCLLPADFLSAVGFSTHREHHRHPRMRMDLTTAVTWRTEMRTALSRLRGAIAPSRPATTETRRVRFRDARPEPPGVR